MLRPDDARRVEGICENISKGYEVNIRDMIWIEKMSGVSSGVREKLRRARRNAIRKEGPQDSLGEFCDAMGIGDPDPGRHVSGFTGAEDIVEWFKEDRPDDWRQRD